MQIQLHITLVGVVSAAAKDI